MEKAKHRILLEIIENIVNSNSLYTGKVFDWMNDEARSLFQISKVFEEFSKEGKIFKRHEANDEYDDKLFDDKFYKTEKFIIPSSQYKAIILRACAKEKAKVKTDASFEKRLEWLRDIIAFNDLEFKIFRLYAYIRRSKVVTAFLNDMFSSRRFGNTEDNVIADYPEILATTEEKVCLALKPNGKLCKSGFFCVNHRHGTFELSEHIVELLRTPVKSQEEMKQLLIGKKQESTISLSEFAFLNDVPCKLKTLLKNAIREKEKGINILLYGIPGTGKTEFAKSLAAAVNENLYGICDGEDKDKEPTREERLSALKTADFVIPKGKGILLFDEAEDLFSCNMFEEKNTSKVFINRFLENNAHPIIWTTNNKRCMDPAYIRRFTAIVPFKEPDVTVREHIWQETLNNNQLTLSKEEIKQLSKDYVVPPAIIASVVRGTKLINGAIEDIKSNLCMYEKAMGGNYFKPKAEVPVFNPSLLNTDIDLEKLADRLQTMKGVNFSLCLYGAPGTGKSAYARYVAERLDLPVVEKKCSDLIDCFVGMTERNIAMAFEEAHEKKALLIFDEADSFLQDRNNASRSWETTQVNEMLTQMEHSLCPFVCTTNLMSKLDKASLRRFTFKARYDYLTTEQMAMCFKHFFEIDVNTQDVERLSCLSPGDFFVVQKQAKILGCMNEKAELLKMLESEMLIKNEEKTYKIGF